MPEMNDLPKHAANVARDTAYVVVGLGVLGLQRAQVQRQALRRRLRDSDVERTLVDLRATVARGIQDFDDLVEEAIGQFESVLEPVERQLPDTLRRVVDEAQVQAREARGRLRELVETGA
jgi:hypothetical protein